MLVVITILALLCAGAMQDMWFGQGLVQARLGEQRTAELAELGLLAGMQLLQEPATPDDTTRELLPGSSPTDLATVTVRLVRESAVPDGFSAGRFIAQDFEIESTGHSIRNARRVLVQGATRMVPAAQGTP